MSNYEVELITPEAKDRLADELAGEIYFERKANIHGACVKLLTDNESFKDEWEDNFRFMNEDVRPHAKIFSIEDGGDLHVMYDPTSKVSIVKNCDYYGWIKSIALATISDFLEDYHSIHRRYSVHGSAVDHMGHAIAIIGPPGTGKTTLTYGLLQDENFNYISDDWFFTRLFSNATVIYSSEKNSYIRDDLADVWKTFSKEVKRVKLDVKGRGIADVNTLFNGRIRESSTLKTVVLLERNQDNSSFRELTPEEGLDYMIKQDFCNPHQMIRDARKFNLRVNFFKELFTENQVYMLNTVETPQESLDRIVALAER